MMGSEGGYQDVISNGQLTETLTGCYDPETLFSTGCFREHYTVTQYYEITAGLGLWRPWRTEENEAPLRSLTFQKSTFTLKFYNSITKTSAVPELQRLSKKYKNIGL